MSHPKLTIGVVYNLEGTENKDPFCAAQVSNIFSSNCIYEALQELGYQAAKVPLWGTLDQIQSTLSAFSPERTFLFSNIDGYTTDPLGAAHLLQFIESLGYQHTGSTGQVTETCTDKAYAKQLLANQGVSTPAFQTFTRPEGSISVRYPAIVKPLYQDASIGISLDSVVKSPTDLLRQVEVVTSSYQTPALVEEFIPGQEFSVSLLGEQALAITEEDYSQIADPICRLITYGAKWDPQDYLYQHITLRCPAALDAHDEGVIIDTALKTSQILGLRDYGRIDFRFIEHTPYVLDINETPDFGNDAGFYNSARASGYSYQRMIAEIMHLALKREGWL